MKSTENRATIYDVAKLAKVSAATVSRVLKGDSSVNASTYRRVEDAAAALKYERRLRQYPPQNCLIVLNVPTLNNAFYSRIISGAQDAAATEGYHVLVNAQQINEVNVEAFLAMLRGVKAVGLIELNALTTDIARYLSQQIPLVRCCEYDDGLPEIAHTDYRELIANPEVEVVYVLTPNVSHCEITVCAFEAGKHVFCEKPMASTSADAQKMLDAWKKSGKKFTIGYQNRFRPEVRCLKAACDRGELGEIYFAKAHAVRRRAVPTWGVFPNKALQGGGPLIDIGTHALDLTLWYMDNYKPKLVVGSVARFMVQKNHTRMLEQFACLKKIYPNSHLLLAGKGELQAAMEEKAKRLGIYDSVSFLGVQKDTSIWYQAMDVFLMPSLFEGLPVVGIEAQASGLPCVFSDTITDEIVLSDRAVRLSLEQPDEVWAKELIRLGTADRDRAEGRSVVRSAGYDIVEETKRLQEIYVSLIEK